jgi:hypothetical protein
VAGEQVTHLDLGQLLGAVENAPPVAAADVVGQRLADALGATDAAFLIADYSGQALVRLGHDGEGIATGTHGHETADRVRLSEGAHGRVLASKRSRSSTARRAFRFSRR